MSECTIFRVKNKTNNFTIMLNEVFQRDDLSARAKGVYGYLMTLPDDWKVYKREVYTHFSDGKTRIDNAFKELENAGYIKKERVKDENNLFTGWSFIIHESAIIPDNRFSENRETRKSENLSLLSTDLNKELTIQSKREPNKQKTRFKKPTTKEVREYADSIDFATLDVEYFIDYYESKGWVVGKSKMKDWKSTVRNWKRREKKTAQTTNYKEF